MIDDKSPAPIHGHPADIDGDGDLDVVMAFGMREGVAPKEKHQIVWYENVGKPGKGTVRTGGSRDRPSCPPARSAKVLG